MTSETKNHGLKPRAITASVAALCALAAAVPAAASAAGRGDKDGDGLSNRAERKIGTSPTRADTDRDRLKDGREVRIGTNPRRADTDGDGVADGQEIREGSDPRIDENEVKGTLTAVGESSVTITNRDGVETVVAIDSSTVLEAPDRDESGTVTLADFQVGDRVEAHMSEDGTVAVKLEVKISEWDLKGRLTAIGESSVTVTDREGVATEVGIDANTVFRVRDRNEDGASNLADFQIGDGVKVKLNADGTAAAELKRDGKGHGHGKGQGKGQGKGSGHGHGRGQESD